MDLTYKQQIQEDEYDFPYHYFDLKCELIKFKYIRYLNIIDHVKSILKPFCNQVILDAGCGDGRFCYELRNEKVKLIGIDFSERAVGFAKIINPHAQFKATGLKDVQLEDKVDVIVCLEVIEHLLPEELKQVVDRFKNLLKKDGFIIVSVPSINIPVERKHYQHFSEASLREIFCNSFKIVSIIGMFDTKSYKSRIFKCMRDIELLLMSSKNTSYWILKPVRIISRWYSKMVEKYFLERIKYCNQTNAASLLLVAQMVN